MKLWIARNIKGELYLYSSEPVKADNGYFYINRTNSDDVIKLNDNDFPDVWFNNSPQQVKLKLVK